MRKSLIIRCIQVILAGLPLAAGQSASSAPAGLAACQSCHGAQGVSESAGIPNLAGQKRNYLLKQLQAFKGGKRKDTFMNAIAAQLDDAQMRELAEHWSQLDAPARATGTVAAESAAIRSRMSFPAGFPKGFTLYDTEPSPETREVIQRYANEAAWAAARAGTALPDGSIVISVTSSARDDGQGRLVADKPVSYSGMESRAGWGAAVPELLRNGNWDYALFSADGSRRETLNQAPCLACHQPIAAASHVFTLKALAAHAGRGG